MIGAENIKKLRVLSFEEQMRIVVQMIERLLPNYVHFSEKERWGDPKILRKMIDLLDLFSKGKKVSLATLEQTDKEVEANTPDMYEFPSNYWATLALDACSALYEAVQFAKTQDTKHIEQISHIVFSSLEAVLQKEYQLSPQLSVEELNRFLDSNSFYQNEIAWQEKIINKIYHKNQTWHLVGLLEWLEDLKVFDPQIRTILWELYETKKNAVYLKLAILDYLAEFPVRESEKTEMIQKYEIYWKGTRNDLLKNQLICNLLQIEPENTVYQAHLLTQIPKTQNYRSLIRVLNFFAEQPILPEVIERVKLAIRQHELAQYESVRVALEK